MVPVGNLMPKPAQNINALPRAGSACRLRWLGGAPEPYYEKSPFSSDFRMMHVATPSASVFIKEEWSHWPFLLVHTELSQEVRKVRSPQVRARLQNRVAFYHSSGESSPAATPMRGA